MDKAMRIRDKQETLDKEISEIKQNNIDAIKARCRVDVVNKGEKMDFLLRLNKERHEALQEENILRSKEAEKLLPSQIEQTERLAEGVLKLKNKEIREQKHRQVLRDQNIELKELEAQLKSTYAAKAAQVQLREREASRVDEKYFENETSVMRNRWYNDDAFDLQMRADELDKKAKYRNEIQDQLINNEILRQQKTEEYHRDRKIVEEISEVLYRENMQLDQDKRDKIAHVQAERIAFFKAKEIWKCKEKEAIFDEFNRDSKIIADKMMEEKNRAVKKSDESMRKDFMMEKIARRMLDEEVKRIELEDIVNELIIQEKNNEIAKELKNNKINKEIVKRELLADMERQKKLIAESKARESAVDNAFGKYLAEEYKKAVINDEKLNDERRRKGIQYGKDLKSVCDQKRQIHAEEILIRKSLQRQDEEEEIQRLKEVGLERSKILYEHSSNLNGFLKAGTLRTEDYEYIRMRQSSPEKS